MSAVLLLSSCHERGVPFPYVPNTPEKYNRQEFGLQDARVAMLTYEQYHEYYEGLASERIVCFDTSGHCVEYFYRGSQNRGTGVGGHRWGVVRQIDAVCGHNLQLLQ